jgi:hypothetical protein
MGARDKSAELDPVGILAPVAATFDIAIEEARELYRELLSASA